MSSPSLSSETLHASCVVKDGRAILISGRSGSGKSDLALRLIDRGASLVSDDYTIVRRIGGKLLASAPPNIAGKLEIRGIGIVELPASGDAPVCMMVDLNRDVERMPAAAGPVVVAGIGVPVVTLNGLEASAPVKVEVALVRFGLQAE
ncbi:MAG: HPr kinase/phosphatase C-terminal domain-containing protein [Pseudomonadota bacterium]|nr:HPr kinase/phosphatase C-terminal domain-containing protein [Pseudomonadota bacterium]